MKNPNLLISKLWKWIFWISLLFLSVFLAACSVNNNWSQIIGSGDLQETWLVVNNTWWTVTWGLGSWSDQLTWNTWKPNFWMEIYSNEEYWFTLEYPKAATIKTKFDEFHILHNTWSTNSTNTWEPIVSIITSRIEQDNSYPRYYDTELRIWISKNPSDIKDCTNLPNGIPTTGKNIWGIDFVWYALDDAAMMQYKWWFSYRAIINKSCFVIEKIKVWSSYRDENQKNDIDQSVLDVYFKQLDPIIDSFKFTK